MTDPRPILQSHAVTRAYAERVLVLISEQLPDLTIPNKERAVEDLNSVMMVSEDGFERALMLREGNWSVNEKVVDLLRESTGLRRRALEQLEIEWVMRTGARFPAKEGDTIVFADPETGFQKNGFVEGVMATRARAVVRVITKKDEPASVISLPAEKVRAVTTAKGSVKIASTTRIKAL